MIPGAEALRIRGFRTLWLGQVSKQLGTSTYWLVMLFTADRITNDARSVAFMGVLQTLPFLLFSAYAGVLADRLDRRKVMLASDLLSAGLLMALGVAVAVLGHPTFALLCVAAFLLASVDSFFCRRGRPPSRSWCRPNSCSRRTRWHRAPSGPSG